MRTGDIRQRRVFREQRPATDPKPDFQEVRNRFGFRTSAALRPNRMVGPNVSFEQVAEESDLAKGFANAEVLIGGALVTHLGTALVFFRDFRHHTSFVNGSGHRFLAEAVFAKTHTHQAGGSVHVVWN